MVYNPNIPNATDLLSNSQGQIKTNFQQANAVFGTDHFPFDDGTVNKGYHKLAHLVTLGTAYAGSSSINDPTIVAGTDIIYAKTYTPDAVGATPDTQLFARTAAGGVSQLTGNRSATNGWSWSGGLLYMWGTTNFSAGTSSHKFGTVNFKNRQAGCIPFLNNCFSITGGLICLDQTDQTASNTLSFLINGITNFSYNYNSSKSNPVTVYPGFYWIAVGN